MKGCNDDVPIPHGDKKTGKCTVTIGSAKYYLPYYVRVDWRWANTSTSGGHVSCKRYALVSLKYNFIVV